MSDANLVARARYTLAISVFLTLVLYLVPHLRSIAYPLLLISTAVHELGHGVAAILAGGTFEKFVMYPDASGVATSSGNFGALGRALVAAGGLVGPAVFAAVCFLCARRASTARYALALMGALLSLAMLLVVRNGFGLFFIGVLATICLLLAIKGGYHLAQLGLAFLATQLALSVYSRGDYLFTRWAQTAVGTHPSDSQNMATALGIGPYWFWGLVCALFSVIVLVAGSWYLVRGAARGNARSMSPVM